MIEDDDWIRGREAFNLVAQAGSFASASQRLREPLLRGRVRARAMDGTLEMRRGYGAKKEVQDWDVPKEVWSGNGNNSAFQLNEGLYQSRDFATGYSFIKLSGLAFSRLDIVKYFGLEEHPVHTLPEEPASLSDPTKDKGGAPLDAEKWANFAAVAVMLQHHCGMIHTGMKKAPVYKMIADYAHSLDLKIPSDTTVSKALDQMKMLSALAHGPDGMPLFDEDGKPLEAKAQAT